MEVARPLRGHGPREHVGDQPPRAGGERRRAQVNFTVEVAIGSNVYVGELPAPSTFVGQGQSTVSFNVPVEETTVNDGWDLEVVLLARSVIFSVPQSGSQLSVLWGADDADASITGDLAVVQMHLLDVETQGADAYVGIVVASPFGTDLLAFSNEMTLRLDGSVVSGDPVETQSADGIRVTWTYTDDDPANEPCRFRSPFVCRAAERPSQAKAVT